MNTTEGLNDALTQLTVLDPRLRALWADYGTPDLRYRPPVFGSLLRVIVSQQLSVAAAGAIWQRLEALCGEMTPAAVLGQDDMALRGVGLSRAKVDFSRSLARAVADGELDFGALDELDDGAAIAALVRIKGIGVWTAECFLLFSMVRPDVLPAGDLALLKGAQHFLELPERPTPDGFREIGAQWKPVRSAAARLLWHCYGGVP